MNFPKIFLTRWARLASILLLAILTLFVTSSSVLAIDYPSDRGDKGEFDLVVNLKGDASKVTKVVATRSVPAHDEKDEDFYAVHTYNLAKDGSSQWKQNGFDFGRQGISCTEMINQQFNSLYDADKGWFNFKVVGYNSSNKAITPETSVVFDIRKDCGKDKAVDINVLASAVDASTRGVLNGTVTIIQNGKEVGVTSLKIQLQGPGNLKTLKSPSTISQDRKTFKFTDITPGTYTLFGQAGCTSSQVGGCSTAGKINTTGEIKAGNNKNDIIINEGVVTFCGDGCDKATAIKDSANGTRSTAGPGPTNGENANDNDNATCESVSGAFGWVLCKIIDGIASAIDTIYTNVIEPLLITKPLDTSSDSDNYQVWSNFRIFGNIFLIIALLVIVFGQSIGGGLIEAYSAKKILPRLLVAAILINLSLYLVAFAIDITNVLGRGIGALIQLPFEDSITPENGGFKFELNGGSAALGYAGLVAGGSAIWAAGATFVPWLLFTVLIPIFFVFIAILAVLILRNALIIFLILIAPVAFALYCLPNTEKYFKQWWDLLWKTLLIYPIIAIMFAMGNVMYVTISNVEIAFADLLALVALVLPLFAIPFAFKLAGGIIGRAADFANGSVAKANGMMKNRKEQSAFRMKQAKAGRVSGLNNRFNDTRLGGVVNRTPGLGRMQGRRTERLDQLNRTLGGDLGKTPGAQAIQHDDPALRAATYKSRSDAVEGLMSADGGNMDRAGAERAASAAAASIGFGRSQALWATEQMGKTGTSFEDQADQAKVIARAAGGNTSSMASLAGNLNSTNKQVGRHDLAPSFATLMKQAQAEAAPAGTVSADAKEKLYADGQENAWNSASLYQHANDKPQNIDAAIGHHEKLLRSSAQAQGNAIMARRAATSTQEIAQAEAAMTDANSGIERAAVFFKELGVMAPNASGAVKLRIDAAEERNGGLLAPAIQSLDDTAPGRTRDVQQSQETRELQPNGDYVVGNRRLPDRTERASERISRASRSFERPNPNRIDG